MKLQIVSIIIGSVLTVVAGIILYFGFFVDVSDEIALREKMDIRLTENKQRLKDLSQIQKQFKEDKGYYADNGDTLMQYLFNSKVEYINSEKAELDSIPSDTEKYKNIQNRISKEMKSQIDATKEARRIYQEYGGEWKIMSEQEKINAGLIQVEYFDAIDLSFNKNYLQKRNVNAKLDLINFSNINSLKNNSLNYTSLNKKFQKFSKDIIQKISLEKYFNEINKITNQITTGDTTISTENITKSIKNHQKKIQEIENDINNIKDKQKESKKIIEQVLEERKKYTYEIGSETILKVKEKAKKKQEQEKQLKGRKLIIYKTITSQDSTENSNKQIVNKCKVDIKNNRNEIQARNLLIKEMTQNIQDLLDLQVMQITHMNHINSHMKNIDSLIKFTLNEKIKIVTILKKSSFTYPTLPNEWRKSQVEAAMLVEEMLGEDFINKVNETYINENGKFRSLSEQEGFDRGLITKVEMSVIDVVFDNLYLKERELPNLDSLTFIPFTNKGYSFSTKTKIPNEQEKQEGASESYFFEISATYDDVFHGLNSENIIMRNSSEKGEIKVGSLEKSTTNGNWGE